MQVKLRSRNGEYEIRSDRDYVHLQESLKEDFEVQHVASELARNILEETETGRIRVQERKIVAEVQIADETKLRRLNNAVSNAKRHHRNGNRSSISEGKENGRCRGRGLLTILSLGWELNLAISGTSIILEAVKS